MGMSNCEVERGATSMWRIDSEIARGRASKYQVALTNAQSKDGLSVYIPDSLSDI